MRISPWRRFQRTLLTGLFIVAPFSLSFMLLVWFVTVIEGMLAPIVGLIGRPVPGLGLIVAFLIVLGVGMLASNIAGQHVLEWSEEMLLKIPGFNWVYRTLKQLSEVFSPSSKTAFKGVVLIEYPRPHVYSMGFVTNELTLDRDGHHAQKLVCVYVPTNHMYIGDFVLVPQDQVLPTQLNQQEGVQAAISAGAALPAHLRSHKEGHGHK